MQPPTAIIVIPCFNEEHRLPVQAIENFIRENNEIGIMLVDDGSTDATQSILRSLSEQKPDRIFFCTQRRNGGKAEAVRLGIVKAMEMNPEFVGYWDADMATPPSYIPVFQSYLKSHPKIILMMGSRKKDKNSHIKRNLFRHAIGRAAAKMLKIILCTPFHDTQCGAKMFRVTDETKKIFNYPFFSRWLFDVEILFRLHEHHSWNRIKEYSLPEWTHIPGSKIGIKDYLCFPRELWRARRGIKEFREALKRSLLSS